MAGVPPPGVAPRPRAPPPGADAPAATAVAAFLVGVLAGADPDEVLGDPQPLGDPTEEQVALDHVPHPADGVAEPLGRRAPCRGGS